MIYELVLRNFDCSLEFVFSLLLLQPFNFSPVSFSCNFQDWGCVILREIDFLWKICWSIPCLSYTHHRKKTKADGSRLIPRKHTETLVLLSVRNCCMQLLLYSGFTFSHYDLPFPTRYCIPYVRSGLYQLVIRVKGFRVCELYCDLAIT